MSLLLSVSWHGVNSAAPDKMPVTIEAIEAHDGMPAYYRLMLGGVWYVITDAHRRQILDALSSAPDLPPGTQSQSLPPSDTTELWDRQCGKYFHVGDIVRLVDGNGGKLHRVVATGVNIQIDPAEGEPYRDAVVVSPTRLIKERNAAVAEPPRGIVNAIGGENAPF